MKRLFVMDGHSHLFRAYHAVGYLSTSKGVPSHAVLILSTMLWKLIREEQPDYLGIALDPPGPTFRDTLYADYKATRTAMPNDLVRQLPYVRRLFEALRPPVIEVPGYEADDVLATLVAHALEHDDVDVVIVTGDKLREPLATGRKDALLSRELAVLNRAVPLEFDLEAFRRVEPDWVKLRSLWLEMEFSRLVKELPPVVVAVSAEPVGTLADADA